jgi:hypothetical protein
MPMIAKIVQTAKQMVKAKVDSQSARLWSDLSIPVTSDTAFPRFRTNHDWCRLEDFRTRANRT